MNWPTLICRDQIGGAPDRPILLGNRCRHCSEPFFPAARGCTRCTQSDLEPIELGGAGRIWSWTMQAFEPKTPFDGGTAGTAFTPYGVGYVELESGLKVESRLVDADGTGFRIGQPVHLVLQSYRHDESGQAVFTYAFESDA